MTFRQTLKCPMQSNVLYVYALFIDEYTWGRQWWEDGRDGQEGGGWGPLYSR